MEREKQMFGKQMFAGPGRDNETQRRILTNRLCQVPPCLHTQFILQLYMLIVPFLKQVLYPYSLGSQGEDQSFFLSFLGLDCFQLEITYMPRRHLGWQIFLSCTVYPVSSAKRNKRSKRFCILGSGKYHIISTEYFKGFWLLFFEYSAKRKSVKK